MKGTTYILHSSITDGEQRYITIFTDGSGHRQETEVTREVYMALDECRRVEKRQKNAFDRHEEHMALTENQLSARLFNMLPPMEDTVAQAIELQAALAIITDTQRRRFLLYHEHGLTYEQIARAENHSKQAIAQSISKAEIALKNYFVQEVDKQGSE